MNPSRGRTWIGALTGASSAAFEGQESVLTARGQLGGESVHYVSVVPDPAARFPRATHGEVGLEEGWTLAACVRAIVQGAAGVDGAAPKPAIVAIVDVPSQAYGRREEQLGIHLALAAAADAYATARLEGHPVIALLVGGAMSGAFLAHGYQANRIAALDDAGVLVQAMGKQAAARITRRTVAEVETLGESALPMSYRVDTFAGFGLVDALIPGIAADDPAAGDVARVREVLSQQLAELRLSGTRDLRSRLQSDAARRMRSASIEVRRRLAAQWAEEDAEGKTFADPGHGIVAPGS